MKFADLHLHTFFSDGTYSPKELILEAQKAGLCAIAIVDHDTIGGIEPAFDLAADRDIEVLPGIEFTAEYDNKEVHILGYLIDYKNKVLTEKLEILRKYRQERAYKIIDKLKGMNIVLEPEAVFSKVKEGTVGRLHIARAMIEKGLASSIFEVFQKYIGDKCHAYVSGFRFSPSEAIKLIKDAGGIPVLAHPYSLYNDELVLKFIEDGLMGLEVYYPEHSQGVTNFYLGLAQKYNLIVTGGSDCHGKAKPDVKVGRVKIPYELVEKLKEAKKKL
ncbi:MAG: PHP domain-containing protein [Candidatus Omnitrophota bacterium]|nr:PHP domain-containing protein [Candidatus Omnitrophota bacterium]